MATLVKGDPKAPFSIATTPTRSGRCYSISWITPPFTLDPNLIMLSAYQRGIKYHFLSFWFDSTWRLNPGLPDHQRTLYS